MNTPLQRLAAVTALLLVAAACSGDDAGEPSTTSLVPAATTEAITTTTTTRAPTTVPATTTTAAATTTTTTTLPTIAMFDADVTFTTTKHPGAVLPLSPQGSWDGVFTYSPNVVEHEGRFHMFYTGWGATLVAVGYAVSDDGLSFERVGDGPILEFRTPVAGRTAFAQRPIVVVEPDGTWTMYLSRQISKRFSGKVILRATAPAPAGPWTLDADPAYTASDESWEQEIVPMSVIDHDGERLLFYDSPGGARGETGLLRSTDGVTFEAIDSDAATPVPDIVMGPHRTQSWDGSGVGSPVVFTTDGGLEMIYLGFEGPDTASERIARFGYARSADGIDWIRYTGNPVFELSDASSGPGSFGYLWLDGLRVGDEYFIYHAIGAGSGGIGLLRVDIDD